MNKTLLAIISHPKDNGLVRRHWPYFKLAGCDILGCGTDDGRCEWPEDVTRMDSGPNGTKATPAGSAIWGLVVQEMHIWNALLNSDYSSVCIVESDGVFTRKLPPHPGGYFVSQMPDFAPPGVFKTPVYFQTPRWSDRDTTKRLLAGAEQMLREGDVEHWMSDRFPARICWKHRIPFQPIAAWSPFAMTSWRGEPFDTQWTRDARAAIQLGAFYIHACKTEKQLDSIKDLIKL